jgi:diacylglycerol kinase family enzyme
MAVVETHVLIAANPKSGAIASANRVAELRNAVQARGFHCEILSDLECVRSTSNKLQAAGVLRAVVSAGGDGTADALANALDAEIPLLIFPLGTENLLAKYLQLTGDVRQACETLVVGQRKKIDVGKANNTLFLVMLSCGFDAEVVRHMHAIRTGHINRWSYTRPILNALFKYRFPRLRVQTEATLGSEAPVGRDAAGGAGVAWLFVFNIPKYAAALNFCPQADPTDGLLDVCTFRNPGVHWGLGYFARLWTGSHQRMRGFVHQRCQRITIAAPVDAGQRELKDVPFQIDGDPGGVLPLEIEVLPSRLTLLVPPV